MRPSISGEPSTIDLKQQKIIPGLLFVGLGGTIIIIFSPYRPIFHGIMDLLGRLVLICLLLIASVYTRKHEGISRYWRLFFGLLILVSSISLDWWAGNIFQRTIVIYQTPNGLFIRKIKSFVIIAAITISFTNGPR